MMPKLVSAELLPPISHFTYMYVSIITKIALRLNEHFMTAFKLFCPYLILLCPRTIFQFFSSFVDVNQESGCGKTPNKPSQTIWGQ